jgi:hypothetical protein
LQNQEVKIQDVIRGEVTWNTNTLGDFVLLRSNGLPVYNFCVAIDDCLMAITHVIRWVQVSSSDGQRPLLPIYTLNAPPHFDWEFTGP